MNLSVIQTENLKIVVPHLGHDAAWHGHWQDLLEQIQGDSQLVIAGDVNVDAISSRCTSEEITK